MRSPFGQRRALHLNVAAVARQQILRRGVAGPHPRDAMTASHASEDG